MTDVEFRRGDKVWAVLGAGDYLTEVTYLAEHTAEKQGRTVVGALCMRRTARETADAYVAHLQMELRQQLDVYFEAEQGEQCAMARLRRRGCAFSEEAEASAGMANFADHVQAAKQVKDAYNKAFDIFRRCKAFQQHNRAVWADPGATT